MAQAGTQAGISRGGREKGVCVCGSARLAAMTMMTPMTNNMLPRKA